jgi:cell division inhibitor SepF
MASLWRRAMVYLGLQDDNEYDYGVDYEYDEESDGGGSLEREPRDMRAVREPQDLRESREPPREPLEPRETIAGLDSGLVRPVPRDEGQPVIARSPAVTRQHHASARVHVVVPQGFNDAQELGDRLKANQPVIMNLQGLSRDLQRRLIDFSSGLAYAVNGNMERVNDQVFLLTPSNVEVSKEEKERLQARGLYRT